MRIWIVTLNLLNLDVVFLDPQPFSIFNNGLLSIVNVELGPI